MHRRVKQAKGNQELVPMDGVSMIFLFFVLSLPSPLLTSSVGSQAPYGCPDTCGNMSIPYPFGLLDGCSKTEAFLLTCNATHHPPRPFWHREYEVLEVSVVRGEIVLHLPISTACYNQTREKLYTRTRVEDLTGSPFTYSNLNKFTLSGCATTAYIQKNNTETQFLAACASACSDNTTYPKDACSGGIGCCQSAIPRGLKNFILEFGTYYAATGTWDYNPCSLAFLADPKRFKFNKTMIEHPRSFDEMKVAVLLDWSMEDATCAPKGDNRSLASLCPSKNTECIPSKNGLGSLCNCSSGYEGNPYVKDGCQDIDECNDPKAYPCYGICINTPGGYNCSCPPGTSGDAMRANGCTEEQKSKAIAGIAAGLGTASALMISLAVSVLLYKKSKKRRAQKHREKFYRKNHHLLEQLIASYNGNIQRTNIFSEKELDKATNKFNDARVVGRGGHGTVYKGMLLDNSVVAIKKSKPIKEEEIEAEVQQFINEVAILSQIDHRNVVRLIGCCLETEIPLLVYEFISNGTLFAHLHVWSRPSNLSWDDRLRIATEIASAVAYMHSAASRSVFHRDLKTTNILLDEKLTAKVSDFGTSKSIMTDQTHITTAVQGTYGYLDPEYYYTGQLTEKSDVYSFGVILLELLTGEKPYSQARSQDERNLTTTFISKMKENQSLQLIETSIIEEAKIEELKEVMRLAEDCLRLRGEERPTMKEVEMILQGLKKTQKQKQQYNQRNPNEEVSKQLSEISIANSTESSVVRFPSSDTSKGHGLFLR